MLSALGIPKFTRKQILTFAFAALSSLVVCVSGILDIPGMEDAPLPFLALAFLTVGVAVYVLASLLWHMLDSPCWRSRGYKGSERRLFLASFVAIALCWIPVLLAGFPGFFNYDGPNQWKQFQSGDITSHHPIVHTYFLGLTMALGQSLFGSLQAGVALSVCIQALAIACILAASTVALKRLGLGTKGLALATAYFALNPIVGLLAFSTTKDSLFSSVVLAYCCMASLLFVNRPGRPATPPPEAKRLQLSPAFAALTALVMLFRINAVPAVLVTFVCTALLMRSHPQLRRYVGSSIAGILIALLVLGPVSAAAGIGLSKAQSYNTFALPMQQIARCTVDSSVSPEDKARIEQQVGSIDYRPNNSDNARDTFTHTPHDNAQVLSLYFQLGITYPGVYLTAFLLNTEDAWSPLSVVDAYKKPVTNTDGSYEAQTSVFEFTSKTESVGRPGPLDSKLPWLEKALMFLSSSESAARLPFVGLLVSIWPFTLALAVCLTRFLICKRRDCIAATLLLPVLALTNLLGPCMLIRYFFYLILALPLMLTLLSVTRQGAQNGPAA